MHTKLLVFLLLTSFFFVQEGIAQGFFCDESEPFCTDEVESFPAGVNSGTAEAGNNYGCLGSWPNPAWYYLQIEEPGAINILETNSNSVDIDFALWGPFSDLLSAFDTCGELGQPIDCSYSPNAIENIDIPNGNEAGDVYLLLITNFGNNATEVFAEQTGGGGSTNCEILICGAQFVNPGPDQFVCNDGISALLLEGESQGFFGGESYTWSTDDPLLNGQLSDPDDPVTVFGTDGLPADFEGEISFTLTVEEDVCIAASEVVVEVIAVANPAWTSPGALCGNNSPIPLFPDGTPGGEWSGEGVGSNRDGDIYFFPSEVSESSEVTYTVGNEPCVQTFTHTIFVTPLPDASWDAFSICENDELVTLSPNGDTGGTWTGNGVQDNGDGTANFNPAGLSDEVSITYTVGSEACQSNSTQTVSVFLAGNPSWIAPQNICSLSEAISLSPTGDEGGFWSGEGITDNGDGTASFNPSELSTNTATVSYSVGEGSCGAILAQDIILIESNDPSWNSPGEICSLEEPIILSPTANFSGEWSGAGITNNTDGTASFSPIGLSGSVVINYSIGQGDCASNLIQSIEVIEGGDASWEAQDVCASTGLIVLSPTGTTGGTWAGEGVNDNGNGTAIFNPQGLQGEITVVYTVGESTCAASSNQNINVIADSDPSWQAPNSICDTEGIIELLAESNLTGSWTGNGITDNNDGSASFDPNGLNGAISISYIVGEGLCENELTRSINVVSSKDPSWLVPADICDDNGLVQLIAVADLDGSWSGNGISDNGDGSAWFNPEGLSGSVSVSYTVGAEPCIASLSQNLNVIQGQADASWTPQSLCSTDDPIQLIPAVTQGGIWSGIGVVILADGTAFFDPSGISGPVSISYSVGSEPCDDSSTQEIVVSQGFDSSWEAPAVVCTSQSSLTLSPDGSLGGIWSGDGVVNGANSTAIFNPAGLSGPIEISYTVGSGICSETSNQIISVVNSPDASWTPPVLCGNSVPISLNSIGTQGGLWTGEGVVNNEDGTATFNPIGLIGAIEVTYTVGTDNCQDSNSQEIIVVADLDANWLAPSLVCSSDNAIVLSPSTDFSGTWVGEGITDFGDGTASFDPANLIGSISVTYSLGSDPCEESLTQEISVSSSLDPSWNAPSNVCASGSAVLLQALGDLNGEWSGEGVVDFGNGTAAFNPNGLLGGIEVTYSLSTGLCSASSTEEIVVIGSEADASWTPISLCESDEPQLLIPNETQGGVWTGEGITDNGDGTAFFDPSGLSSSVEISYSVGTEPCNDSSTQSISILSSPDASWTTAVNLLCSASEPVLLSPTNNLDGVWTGNGVTDLGNGTASFSPIGLEGGVEINYSIENQNCGNSFSQIITVVDQPDASWTTISLCESDEPQLLIPNETQGGVWTGAGISDNGDGTAFFDPSGLSSSVEIGYSVGTEPCNDSSTQSISILSSPDASWTTAVNLLCSASEPVLLSPTNNLDGVWTGNGVTDLGNGTASFSPTGLEGEVEVSYSIENQNCGNSFSQIITVVDQPDASWEAIDVCAESEAVLLVPSETGNGAWTGAGISNNGDGTAFFDPTGLTGEVSIMYSVNLSECQADLEQNITILPVPDSTWSSLAEICEDEGVIILTAEQNETGIWTGPGVIDNNDGTASFNPTGLIGLNLINYAVNTSECSSSTTNQILVTDTPTSDFTLFSSNCTGVDSYFEINYAGTANVNTASFDWDFDGGEAISTGVQSYEVYYPNSASSGESVFISLTVTENGCVSLPQTYFVDLEEALSPPNPLLVSHASICNDQDVEDNSYSVQLSVNGGFGGPYNAIVNGEQISFATSYLAGPFTTGEPYIITVSDNEGCAETVEGIIFNCSPLPVEIIRFDGRAEQEGNLLFWETASEQNNDYFSLMKSKDGFSFEKIAEIKGAGTTSLNQNYQFVDKYSINGLSYYKLEQTDWDGTTNASNTISILREENSLTIVEIKPIPAQNTISVAYETGTVRGLLLQVYTIDGRLITSRILDVNQENTSFNLDVSSYSNGFYFLKLSDGQRTLIEKFGVGR